VPGSDQPRRCVILTEGQTHPTPAKTAAGFLRYCPEQAVALLDSQQAGRDSGELLGVGHGIPIVADVASAGRLGANTLLIGITPAGGQLPLAWRALILQAIHLNMDVISGLHTILSEDAEFQQAALDHGVRITDLRLPPKDLSVNRCRSAGSKTFRIHTVGIDCNCGKKVTALEVNRSLKNRGLRSEFIATGQTGILISGKGIAMDRVIADFISGAAEKLVLDNEAFDFLVIEGQGSLAHPLYSGVTLGMLHGFAPQALILCHQVGRTIMRGTADTPMPSLKTMIDLYERISAPVFPARVVGVALNLMTLTDEKQARDEVKRVEDQLQLPATDVIRFGADKLTDAALYFHQKGQVHSCR